MFPYTRGFLPACFGSLPPSDLEYDSFCSVGRMMKYIVILSILLAYGCASVERPYVNPNRINSTHNYQVRW